MSQPGWTEPGMGNQIACPPPVPPSAKARHAGQLRVKDSEGCHTMPAHPRHGHVSYEYLPMPQVGDQMVVDMCTSYFDAEAPAYDDLDSSVERRRDYLGAIDGYVVRRLSALGQCRSVLSFGSGTGRREQRITTMMSDHGPTIVGVERSPNMAAISARRGIQTISSLEAAGSPEANSMDAVLCLYSFIHLPSPASRRGTLSKLVDALRPGGLLILDVFNLHDTSEWTSKLADGGRGNRPDLVGERRGDVLYRRTDRTANLSYMHYFTIGEISSLLEDTGLVITDLIGVGHGAEPGRIGVPLDKGCLLLACTKPQHQASVNASLGQTTG